MKVFFGIIGGIVLFFAAIFAINYYNYGTYAFFAPKMEAVRRDTEIQSRAYSEGMARELSRLRIQYLQAKTPEEKDAIRAMVQHETQAVDVSRLPPELQQFVRSL